MMVRVRLASFFPSHYSLSFLFSLDFSSSLGFLLLLLHSFIFFILFSFYLVSPNFLILF